MVGGRSHGCATAQTGPAESQTVTIGPPGAPAGRAARAEAYDHYASRSSRRARGRLPQAITQLREAIKYDPEHRRL